MKDRWHYDVLRGLEYFARAHAPRDIRLQDAIELLHEKRHKDGRWHVQQKYPGKVFFDMERTGERNRWNTLRATGAALVERHQRRHSVKHVGAGESIPKPSFRRIFACMLNITDRS